MLRIGRRKNVLKTFAAKTVTRNVNTPEETMKKRVNPLSWKRLPRESPTSSGL